MLSPESALILGSRRVMSWNAEQLRLYAELEGVDLVQLRAEQPAELRARPIVATGPPVVPSPPTGAAAARRARSLTP